PGARGGGQPPGGGGRARGRRHQVPLQRRRVERAPARLRSRRRRGGQGRVMGDPRAGRGSQAQERQGRSEVGARDRARGGGVMREMSFEAPGPGSWEIESLHFPIPITPVHAANLSAQFAPAFRTGTRRFGLLLDTIEHRTVNGFDYVAPRIVGAPKGAKGPPPKAVFKVLTWIHPEVRRRLRTSTTVFIDKPWKQDVARWEEELKPEAIRAHLALAAVDPGALPEDALLAHLG